mmetsp:Transcript_63201/g.170482  ORF Transcript_63201/g.170482 Transcript_63201/m.170482 type:complete len:276 (-) Transcript_63201:369-1196(-)
MGRSRARHRAQVRGQRGAQDRVRCLVREPQRAAVPSPPHAAEGHDEEHGARAGEASLAKVGRAGRRGRAERRRGRVQRERRRGRRTEGRVHRGPRAVQGARTVPPRAPQPGRALEAAPGSGPRCQARGLPARVGQALPPGWPPRRARRRDPASTDSRGQRPSAHRCWKGHHRDKGGPGGVHGRAGGPHRVQAEAERGERFGSLRPVVRAGGRGRAADRQRAGRDAWHGPCERGPAGTLGWRRHVHGDLRLEGRVRISGGGRRQACHALKRPHRSS